MRLYNAAMPKGIYRYGKAGQENVDWNVQTACSHEFRLPDQHVGCHAGPPWARRLFRDE